MLSPKSLVSNLDGILRITRVYSCSCNKILKKQKNNRNTPLPKLSLHWVDFYQLFYDLNKNSFKLLIYSSYDIVLSSLTHQFIILPLRCLCREHLIMFSVRVFISLLVMPKALASSTIVLLVWVDFNRECVWQCRELIFWKIG